MRLLADENVPASLVNWLNRLGHHAEDLRDFGLGGSGDRVVLAYTLENNWILLSLNKFKKGPDRRDALEAMANGARILRLTARGLTRQEQALEQCIGEVEESFEKDPFLRRVTIMNNFRVRYETEADIQHLMHRGS